MAKKDQVGSAFNDLLGPEKKQDKDKDRNYKSIGIALMNDQIDRLNEISEKIGYNRSELVRFAIDEFIRRFDSGEIKAATETKTVTVLKSE
jgi:metal-responsive CopG/Arc/MetJ family transcriptional regulator